jgi:hypothetical protein
VSPLLATKLDASRVLGLISFNFHPGSPFFLASEMHVVIARLCLFLLTPLALSPQKNTPVPTTTLALSLLRRSLTRSVCSDVPAGLSRSPPPVARALRIALNFFAQKASAAAGRPTACAMEKGARADVDCAVLRAVAAAATLPSILLLGRARLVESPHQDEVCSFGVWNADGVCCSSLDVQTAPRRLREFLKRGQWFSKSNKGGYEKLWCSGNALPLY